MLIIWLSLYEGLTFMQRSQLFCFVLFSVQRPVRDDSFCFSFLFRSRWPLLVWGDSEFHFASSHKNVSWRGQSENILFIRTHRVKVKWLFSQRPEWSKTRVEHTSSEVWKRSEALPIKCWKFNSHPALLVRYIKRPTLLTQKGFTSVQNSLTKSSQRKPLYY